MASSSSPANLRQQQQQQQQQQHSASSCPSNPLLPCLTFNTPPLLPTSHKDASWLQAVADAEQAAGRAEASSPNAASAAAAAATSSTTTNTQLLSWLGGEQPERPLDSTTIRVFVSSTFVDTQAERNALLQLVHPTVSEYARESGLTVLFVDFRFGIRDTATSDHLTASICLREIDKCRSENSSGPFFLFIGTDRLGFRPAPHTVDIETMATLRAAMEQELPPPPPPLSGDDADSAASVHRSLSSASNTSAAATSLLEQCYMLDNNHHPPRYQLRPLDQFLPEGSFEERQEQWWATQDALLATVRAVLPAAPLTPAQRLPWEASVTELEVYHAIMDAQTPSSPAPRQQHATPHDRCLVIVREIIGAEEHAGHGYVEREAATGAVNREARARLAALHRNALSRCAPGQGAHYRVAWSESGITGNTHPAYLLDFAARVTAMLKAKIRDTARARDAMWRLPAHLLHVAPEQTEVASAPPQPDAAVLEKSNEAIAALQAALQAASDNHSTQQAQTQALLLAAAASSQAAAAASTAALALITRGEHPPLSSSSSISKTPATESVPTPDASASPTLLSPRARQLLAAQTPLVIQDVKQQMAFIDERGAIVLGRDAEVTALLQTAAVPGSAPPQILAGPGGSGKSALFALATRRLREDFPASTAIVSRFCGTSPATSSPRRLVSSLSAHLALLLAVKAKLFSFDPPPPPSSAAASPNPIQPPLLDAAACAVAIDAWAAAMAAGRAAPLVAAFHQLLQCFSAAHPLVLVLDSLDQLVEEAASDDADAAEALGEYRWLPRQSATLAHVALLVSVLDDPDMAVRPLAQLEKLGLGGGDHADADGGISDNPSPAPVQRLQPLPPARASEILMAHLRRQQRTLATDKQRTAALAAAQEAESPLVIHLLAAQLAPLKSWEPLPTVLPRTVEQAIVALVQRVQHLNGERLVHATLSLLAALPFGEGLSEAELADVLSMDDGLLDSVFEYHVPPIRRLPPLVLTRLLEDLGPLLARRQGAGGELVVAFHHRVFWHVLGLAEAALLPPYPAVPMLALYFSDVAHSCHRERLLSSVPDWYGPRANARKCALLPPLLAALGAEAAAFRPRALASTSFVAAGVAAGLIWSLLHQLSEELDSATGGEGEFVHVGVGGAGVGAGAPSAAFHTHHLAVKQFDHRLRQVFQHWRGGSDHDGVETAAGREEVLELVQGARDFLTAQAAILAQRPLLFGQQLLNAGGAGSRNAFVAAATEQLFGPSPLSDTRGAGGVPSIHPRADFPSLPVQPCVLMTPPAAESDYVAVMRGRGQWVRGVHVLQGEAGGGLVAVVDERGSVSLLHAASLRPAGLLPPPPQPAKVGGAAEAAAAMGEKEQAQAMADLLRVNQSAVVEAGSGGHQQQQLVAVRGDGLVLRWDLSSRTRLAEIAAFPDAAAKGHLAPVGGTDHRVCGASAVGASGDGALLVGSALGDVALFAGKDGSEAQWRAAGVHGGKVVRAVAVVATAAEAGGEEDAFALVESVPRVVSVGDDGRLCVLDMVSGALLGELPIGQPDSGSGRTRRLLCVAAAPANSPFVLVGGDDGLVVLVELVEGGVPKEVVRFSGAACDVLCVGWAGELVLAGTQASDMAVYAWSRSVPQLPQCRYTGHGYGVLALECAGAVLLSGSSDATVRRWKWPLPALQSAETLAAAAEAARLARRGCVVMSIRSCAPAAGSGDDVVLATQGGRPATFWKIVDGGRFCELDVIEDPQAADDGWGGSLYDTVVVQSPRTGATLGCVDVAWWGEARLRAGGDAVNQAAGRARLWQKRAGGAGWKVVWEHFEQEAGFVTASVTACGGGGGGVRVAVCAMDGRVRVWEMDVGAAAGAETLGTPRLVAVLAGPEWFADGVREAAFAPSGPFVALAGQNGRAGVWNLDQPEAPVAMMDNIHRRFVRSIAYVDTDASSAGEAAQNTQSTQSPRRRRPLSFPGRVITASGDATLGLWTDGGDSSGRSVQQVQQVQHHSHVVWQVRAAPGGDMVASVSEDGACLVTDCASGRELAAYVPGVAMRAVAWVDRRRLVVGLTTGALELVCLAEVL